MDLVNQRKAVGIDFSGQVNETVINTVTQLAEDTAE